MPPPANRSGVQNTCEYGPGVLALLTTRKISMVAAAESTKHEPQTRDSVAKLAFYIKKVTHIETIACGLAHHALVGKRSWETRRPGLGRRAVVAGDFVFAITSIWVSVR